MSSEDQDGGELQALRELAGSEGWRRLKEYQETQWGAEATLQRIEAAVSQAPMGDQAAVLDLTQHVLTAQKQIRSLMAWPEARMKELTTRKPGNWLTPHRRVAR